MDDFENLIKALKEHKKICFHKSDCKVCKVKTHDDQQCDYCGKLSHRHEPLAEYYCNCDKKINLLICDACEVNVTHYEIIEPPSDENDFIGIYINDCCPITKGII